MCNASPLLALALGVLRGVPRTTPSVEICSYISPFIGVIGRRWPGCESAILLARTAVPNLRWWIGGGHGLTVDHCSCRVPA